MAELSVRLWRQDAHGGLEAAEVPVAALAVARLRGRCRRTLLPSGPGRSARSVRCALKCTRTLSGRCRCGEDEARVLEPDFGAPQLPGVRFHPADDPRHEIAAVAAPDQRGRGPFVEHAPSRCAGPRRVIAFDADVVAPAVPLAAGARAAASAGSSCGARQGCGAPRRAAAPAPAGSCRRPSRTSTSASEGPGSRTSFPLTVRTSRKPSHPAPPGKSMKATSESDLSSEPDGVDAGPGATGHVLHQALVRDDGAELDMVSRRSSASSRASTCSAVGFACCARPVVNRTTPATTITLAAEAERRAARARHVAAAKLPASSPDGRHRAPRTVQARQLRCNLHRPPGVQPRLP